jgi:hypothetical protein
MDIQEIRYQVGEAWKGTYDAATVYGNAAVVQDPTGLSVYRSLKSGNTGHPLTDPQWWFRIIDMSSIKAEADRLINLDTQMTEHEAERVSAEDQRISHENARINAETARINAENARANAESARVQAEQNRVTQENLRINQEQARMGAEQQRVTKEQQRVSQEASRVAAETQRQLNENNRQAVFAEDHAVAVADHQQADQDHTRAEADHETAVIDHGQMTDLVERADADHVQAGNDHTRAEEDHTTAASDHVQAGQDHTRAGQDHTTAAADHTQAVSDHETAAADHTQAVADHETLAPTVAEHTQQIADLQDIVADIETIAEGYVRVAGSSSPALSYKSYKYHEQGGFGHESVFYLFYPCLVGTKLSGNDAQVGKILFVLKKFGAKTVDGTPMWEDVNGNMHAIDGSEGDIQICNIEPYYSIDGQHEIGGTIYDVFLKSRVPFTWQGINAELVEKFGLSPDFCVSHQDTDNVTRMHSVYNPAWDGSYQAPDSVVGKFIYSQDAETGEITETYDATATLLGGAGGLHTTDLDLPTGEQQAMNNNPDTTKTVPFMNNTAHGEELFFSMMLSEGGTFDAHNATLMGSGFCANDGATSAADWEESASGAKNGMRIVDKDSALKYFNLNGQIQTWTGKSSAFYVGQMINSWRNPFHIMEAYRAVCYAIQNDVHELEWFVFEGNKYKWRSVPGFAGPAQGEMTCVVWKMLSTKAASNVLDPTDKETSIEGNRIDFLLSVALFHGRTTQVSPSQWTSGLVFTEDDSQNYEAYIERDQTKLTITPYGDKDVADAWPFESNYLHVGSFTNGDGYRKNYNNDALMLPDTNANKSGASLHTYVGAYNWFTGAAAPSGKKSVRGFRRGSYAYYTTLSPLSLGANYSPSVTYTIIGFGTCCRISE